MDCKNCNTTLNEEQRFCDECGAKVIQNRLTPKILATQVNEEFISIDNKLLRTFIALFIKPEDVIEGYINGVRKKYIGVITYYAIALTVLGFQMFLLKNLFPEFLESQSAAFADSFKAGSNGIENPFAAFPDYLNDYQGVFFSILMPFIAIGTWIVYLDKRRHNYTEHLVINLYMTAQTIYVSFTIYILFAAFNFKDYLIASLVATPIIIIYGAYVFKRLYKSSYISATLRYIVAFIIYMFVFFIIIMILAIAIILYLFATGKINT